MIFLVIGLVSVVRVDSIKEGWTKVQDLFEDLECQNRQWNDGMLFVKGSKATLFPYVPREEYTGKRPRGFGKKSMKPNVYKLLHLEILLKLEFNVLRWTEPC